MNQPKIPQSVLASLPKSREVISIHGGVDALKRFIMLKVLLRDRTTESVVIPIGIAFHISRSVGSAIGNIKYRDIRRRGGDARPKLPEIRTFLENQPDIEQRDWDETDKSKMAEGCEVRAFKDAVFLGFKLIASDIYKILAVPPSISFYLVDMIEQVKREAGLIDIATTESPSDQKH
jgi:hypothetical protein